MSKSARNVVSAGLASVLTLTAFAAAVDARAGTVHIGKFFYDPGTRTLRLPWSKAAPTVKVFHEPGGKVAYAEFAGPSGKSEFALPPQSLNPDRGILARILQAQNRPGTVRIAVRGNDRVGLVPKILGKGEHGVVVFKVQDWETYRTTGRRHWKVTTYDHNHVGAFSYFLGTELLKLPISGPKPTWKILRESPDLQSIEINGDGGIPAFVRSQKQVSGKKRLTHFEADNSGVKFFSEFDSGRYKRIHVARTRKGVVRLSVRGLGDPDLKPRLVPQGKTGRGWLLVFEVPRKAPVAVQPPPPPPSSPPPPVEIVAPPPPPVVVVPPPAPPAAPPPPPVENSLEPLFPSRVMLEARLLGFDETLPDDEDAATLNVPQPNEWPVIVRALYLRHKIAPTWSGELDLRWWEHYTVLDQRAEGNKQHGRDEGWIRAGVSRNLQLLGMTQNIYGGLQVRGVAVSNLRPAKYREYLASDSQIYVGPVGGTTVTLPIWGPVSGVVGISAQPVWTIMDTDIKLDAAVKPEDAGALAPLPFMFGAQGEFGLEFAWERWVSRLSYKFETFRPIDRNFQTHNSAGLSLGYRY